jgi:MSHA biogenesis protein MshL
MLTTACATTDPGQDEKSTVEKSAQPDSRDEKEVITPDERNAPEKYESHSGSAEVSQSAPLKARNDRKYPVTRLNQKSLVNEKKFDVSAVNASAKSFFMGLVRDDNVNIVVHPDVTGSISISLKQVSLEQVLNAVCDVYNFDYVKEQYGYKILPRTIQTRLFKLDYLNVSREGKSNTRVSNGQVSNANSGRTGGNANSSSNSQQGQGGQNSTQITNSEIETTSKSDFWETIEASVVTIIGDTPEKRVVVSPQVGLILVEAYSSELRSVEHFLKSAENALLKQVVIEAKILEVALNENFQAGVQWDTFEQGFGGQLELNDSRVGAGFQSGDISKLVSTAIGGVFSVGLNFTDFTSIIEVLQSQGDVQVLSSPRISTVNNQKAVIKVGSEEYFVTNISNDTNQGTTGSTTTTDVTISPFFSGIALDVTPHISNENTITLHIHPTITTVTDKIKEVGLAESPLILPLAFKTVRESDSIVKAQSGQVVVLGGLIQNRVDNKRADIPWLHKIPFFGLLFSQRQDVMVKSELVILLRPKVIETESYDSDMTLIEERFSDHYQQTGGQPTREN